jgi:RNA polymerase sigma-70 factor (ECF subfamily)
MISVSNEREFMAQYDEFYDRIYNYIFRSILHTETTEDLTSNTFFKALRYIRKKNTRVKNFSAWIYKIATNEILSHLKYKRGKKTVSIDDEKLSLGKVLADEKCNPVDKYVDFLMVKEALGKLKDIERIMVEIHFFEGKDYSEMSQVLNMKESTLRSRIHRLLKKLKKLLSDKVIEEE